MEMLLAAGKDKMVPEGHGPDPRNMLRDCNKAVLHPRETTEKNVEMELFIVQKKLEELKIKAPAIRQEHLKACLKQVQDKADEKAASAIL